MVQCGRGARFLLESVEAVDIGRERDRQHFDRDVALESRIARPVDFAHAARSDCGQDFIRAKPVTGG